MASWFFSSSVLGLGELLPSIRLRFLDLCLSSLSRDFCLPELRLRLVLRVDLLSTCPAFPFERGSTLELWLGLLDLDRLRLLPSGLPRDRLLLGDLEELA